MAALRRSSFLAPVAPLFAALLLVLALAPEVPAHAPHDVISAVGLSPDFASDGLVLIQGTLLDHRIVGWSDDRGGSWHEVGGPLALAGVKRFAFSPDLAVDGVVFAATETDGVWRSTDRGRHFTALGGPMAGLVTTGIAVSPDFASDGVVLVTTHLGLFRSDDGGDTWATVSTGLTEIDLRSVDFGGGSPTPVAYCGGLVMHRSDDLGLTWVGQTAFPSFIKTVSCSPHHDVDQSAVVCLQVDGVRTTNNGGALWRLANTGLTDQLTMDIVLTDGLSMVLGTRSVGVFVSPDLDGPWTIDMSDFEELDPVGSPHFRSVAASPQYASDGTAFVGAFEGLYRTEDHGANWTQLDVFHQLVEIRLAPSPRFVDDGLLFVGTYGGGVKLWHDPRPGRVAGAGHGRGSQATGASPLSGGPAPAPGPLPAPGQPGGPHAGPLAGNPLHGYWETRANGLISKWCDTLDVSPDFEQDGTLFYGYWGGFRSTDRGHTWQKLSLPSVQVVRDIAISPDYANDQTVIFGTNSTGVWRSTDGGDSWSDVSASLPANVRTRRVRFSPDYANDQTVFLATWDDKVQRSLDGGSTWAAADAGITNINMRGFALSPDFANDDTLLVGTRGDGVFRSTDRGDSWTAVNTGLEGSGPWSVESVAFSPDFAVDHTVFCTTMAGGVYRSTDGGSSWQLGIDGLPLTAVRDVLPSPGFADDRTLFVATHEGVFRSRDGGDSWTSLPKYARVDDNHPVVEFAGTWTETSEPGAYSFGVTSSDEPGARTALPFLAREITWYAQRGPDAGLAEVWIDGELEAVIDLYAPVTEPQVPLLHRSFEDAQWRRIEIMSVGTGNAASTGAWVRNDGWEWQR